MLYISYITHTCGDADMAPQGHRLTKFLMQLKVSAGTMFSFFTKHSFSVLSTKAYIPASRTVFLPFHTGRQALLSLLRKSAEK
jgi:hypothetical protein